MSIDKQKSGDPKQNVTTSAPTFSLVSASPLANLSSDKGAGSRKDVPTHVESPTVLAASSTDTLTAAANNTMQPPATPMDSTSISPAGTKTHKRTKKQTDYSQSDDYSTDTNEGTQSCTEAVTKNKRNYKKSSDKLLKLEIEGALDDQ